MATARCSVRERDLKEWLRSQTEEIRLEYILECLQYRYNGSERIPLLLAAASITSKDDAATILDLANEKPDASFVKYWLDFGSRILGSHYVIKHLESHLDDDPEYVGMALYWIPSLITDSAVKAEVRYRALYSEAKRRGIVRY